MKNHVVLIMFVLCTVVGCPEAPMEEKASECQKAVDCEAGVAPPCAGCPGIASSWCLSGVCTQAQPSEADVSINVMLARGEMTSETQSLVYVVAPEEGPFGQQSCASAWSDFETLATDLNVILTGYKSVSGGSFHEDISLGRAPTMPLIIIVWGTSEVGGEGTWTGQGCLKVDLSASLPEDLIVTLQ